MDVTRLSVVVVSIGANAPVQLFTPRFWTVSRQELERHQANGRPLRPTGDDLHGGGREAPRPQWHPRSATSRSHRVIPHCQEAERERKSERNLGMWKCRI